MGMTFKFFSLIGLPNTAPPNARTRAPTTAPPPGNGANSNAANFFPARAAVTFEAMANPETGGGGLRIVAHSAVTFEAMVKPEKVLAKLAGFNGRLASAGNGDVLSDAELGALTVNCFVRNCIGPVTVVVVLVTLFRLKWLENGDSLSDAELGALTVIFD
ncbi:hypothetical protein T492DRAFT_842531 [Pavlovales sp. CCMP2436]|nr:hypothetical protein T492DRAFT_842531 [Pavlovales sp. CCMP2436]